MAAGYLCAGAGVKYIFARDSALSTRSEIPIKSSKVFQYFEFNISHANRWGTVHEGHKLPVQHQNAAHDALGPKTNDATIKAMDLDGLAHQAEAEGGGGICMLNHPIAAALEPVFKLPR